ncbi:MAG: hypothetical protein OZ921_15685, partial [Sorangiineae bacterium]|nr:hypothetical protein [Sorangiineae bacterium]
MRYAGWSLVALALALAPRAQAFVWPNTADRIERELSDPSDVAARRRAAARLDELPRALAARLARTALGDADPDVRLAGATTALALGRDDVGP